VPAAQRCGRHQRCRHAESDRQPNTTHLRQATRGVGVAVMWVGV
jgi:hypothetical protein